MADIKKVVQEQDFSATQIKEIANDVKHKQHRAAADTNDFISKSKYLKHMEKKRQKMTTPYIRSQSSDPTPSTLKAVQTVTQNMDTLSPNTEKLTQITSSERGSDLTLQRRQ